jgi:hypothetical protein
MRGGSSPVRLAGEDGHQSFHAAEELPLSWKKIDSAGRSIIPAQRRRPASQRRFRIEDFALLGL